MNNEKPKKFYRVFFNDKTLYFESLVAAKHWVETYGGAICKRKHIADMRDILDTN